MAFRTTIKSWFGTSSPKRAIAEKNNVQNFLAPESVVINDRTRKANKLGEGSFAKVYKGDYEGKSCAVKVFKEDVLKKEYGSQPDPEHEFETLSLLTAVRHAHIVRVFGMWYDPHKEREAVSIVMELCDESLYEFIRRYNKGKIIPKEKKLLILRDIARGMVYLHSQNIIHGDLRSSNVLLCHSEEKIVAKLADFDMARHFDPETQSRFTTRFTDAEYLPPEVFDHKEQKDPKEKWARLTPKVDVFCFGELALEMSCGSYPKPAGKFNGQEMLTEIQRRDKYLVKLKPSDKEAFGLIMRKCLIDAPENRPSFTDVLLDVEGHLKQYGERPDLDKLQDKAAECEALRAQAAKWEADAKRKEQLEKELAKVKAENQDFQVNQAIKDSKIEELQKQVQSRQEDLEKSQSLCGQVEMLESQLETTKKELNDKTELVGARTTELRMFHDKIVAAEEETNEVKKELQQKDADWANLQETYKSVMTEKDQFFSDLTAAKENLKALEVAKSSAEAELARVKKDKDTLKEIVESGHTSLANMTSKHSEAMQELSTLNDTITKKANTVKELQDKSQKQQDVIQQLNRDLLNMKQEMKKLDDKVPVLEQERNGLQFQLNESTKSADALVKERDQHLKKLQDKEAANATLIRTVREREEELQLMKQRKASSDSSGKGKEDQIGKLKTQLKTAQANWDTTMAQLDAAVACKKDLESTVQELQKKHDLLKNEHEKELAEQMEDLKRVKGDLDTLATAKEEETAALKQDHAALLQKKDALLTEKEREICKLCEELSHVQKELSREKEAFEKVQTTQQKAYDEVSQHSRHCESERDTLRKEKETWSERIAEMESKLERTMAEISNLEQARKTIETELQSTKDTAKSQLQADYSTISKLQDELQAEESRVADMQTAAIEKDKELSNYRAQLSSATGENEAMMNEKEDMKRTLEAKVSEISRLTREVSAAKATRRQKENKLLTEFQEKLTETESQNTKLLRDKADSKDREDGLQKANKELQEQLSDLTTKVGHCEQEKEQLGKEKAELLQHKQQLELEATQKIKEMDTATKEKEDFLMQYKKIETQLVKLSGNHAKKMAELEKEIQILKEQQNHCEEGRECGQLTGQESVPREKEVSERQQATKLQEENKELRWQLQENRKHMEVFAQQKSQDLLLRQTLATEKKDLEVKLAWVSTECSELLHSKQQLTDRLEDAQNELEKIKAIANATAAEKDTEFQKGQQLKDELGNLRRVQVEKEEQARIQYEDLQHQYAEQKREYEDLRNQLLKTKCELEEREAIIHSLDKLKKNAEKTEQLQADSRATIWRQEKENNTLKEHISQLKHDLERNSKELKDSQRSLEEKLVEYATVDRAKNQLEAELQEKTEQLEWHLEEVASLGQRLQSMTAEKEVEGERATIAEERNSQMEMELSNVTTQLKEVTRQCELSAHAETALKAQLDERNAEAEELQAMCSDLKSSLASEESARKSLEKATESYQSELKELHGSEKASQRTIKDLGGMLQKTELDKEHYRQETVQLKNDLHQEQVLKRQLEVSIESCKGAIEVQATELNGCKASMDDMRQKMSALCAEKSSLEARLTEKQNLLCEKEEEVTQLIEEGKQLKVSFESQRQRLLDQLLEEKKLKSEGDATIALLRNEVAAFEQDTVAKKEENERTSQNLEIAEAGLKAVKLDLQVNKRKLQDLEAKMGDKVKECHQMEDAQLKLLSDMEELKCRSEEAMNELQLKLKNEIRVLRSALEKKTISSMELEEKNRRLMENQMDQKKIRQQKQMLKQSKADLQKGFQKVKEEKEKQQWEQVEHVKKAMVEEFRAISKQDRSEMAQEQQKATEKVLSALTTVTMNQEQFSHQLAVQETTLEHCIRQEAAPQHEVLEQAMAVQQEHNGACQRQMDVAMETSVKPSVTASVQTLLTLHTIATFSPPWYLHSWSGQFVEEEKKLEQGCCIETIAVCSGNLKSLMNSKKLPTADDFRAFVRKVVYPDCPDELGTLCLVIPYITFSDKTRLCRLFVCHTPAGCDDKGSHLHPETVAAIAEVVLKPSSECSKKLKTQACAEGLVYSPTWHFGHSDELQACFTTNKLLPELIPFMQQLEVATAMKVKERLCEALSLN